MASHTSRVATPRPSRGLRVAGWVLAVGLALLMLKWVLITAVLLAVPFGLWWAVDRARRDGRERAEAALATERAAARRAEVESRAIVDAAGGCGWCGDRVAHRDAAGRLVMPREHHREDIEQTLAAA